MKNKLRYGGLGYIESPPDARDIGFFATPSLADMYTTPDMYDAFNQGDKPICAAVSISMAMSWQNGIHNNWTTKFISPYDIFSIANGGDKGLVLRDALKVMKNIGVDDLKIKMFARLHSIEEVKTAIMINGVAIIGTYAYDNNRFWQNKGDLLGGHATILTGWNTDGFVLQNSWGKSWGDKGRMTMPYKDFDAIIEAWTLFV